MIMPEKLVNFRVYEDGTDLLGTADVEMPNFEALTETISGAGIAGEVESPVIGHYGSQEVKINWRTVLKDNIRLMEPEGHHLDIRGAQQMYDTNEGKYKIVPIKVVIHGVPKSSELGKLEKGAPTDTSNTLECYYIKVTLDGKEVIELDKYNYICKINDKDFLDEVRKALGLM